MPNTRNSLTGTMLPAKPSPPVEWISTSPLVPYEVALSAMDRRAAEIASGRAGECVWLLEHPPIYTAGSRARGQDLVDPHRFPVHQTGRGGELTYHGPGQRIAYIMVDLKRRHPDIRRYIATLEQLIINSLKQVGVKGDRRENRVGVWVERPDRPRLPSGETAEDKIAAIGVRVRKWITMHGISVNISPDLSHYGGIVPCGVTDHGVTSLEDLGISAPMAEFDDVLRREFEQLFGASADADDYLLVGGDETMRQIRPSEVANRNR